MHFSQALIKINYNDRLWIIKQRKMVFIYIYFNECVFSSCYDENTRNMYLILAKLLEITILRSFFKTLYND